MMPIFGKEYKFFEDLNRELNANTRNSLINLYNNRTTIDPTRRYKLYEEVNIPFSVITEWKEELTVKRILT